ncbi:MAG TPA: hypothetical protein VFS00_00940 [Polyangiaceae bacterium]|nr:hypothetical protein [Polyangiaceae bacterium]
MRTRTLVAALLGAGAAMVAPSPSRAAPPGPNAPVMHVLEIATDDADDQAKAVTLALRHRVRESKEYALDGTDHSLQVFSLALHCPDPPDAPCQSKIADKLGAKQYFWGTMKKVSGNHVTLDLHLWQRGRSDVHERFTFSDNLTEPRDPALERLADQMYQRLVFFGRVGVARLTAERAIEGELFVNGRAQGPISHAQHELTLPPGDYTFEVRSGGRVTLTGRGRVTASQAHEVRLLPVRSNQPDGISQPIDVEVGVRARAPDGSSSSSWRRPVGIVGLGVGGALLAAGAFASVRVLGFGEDEAYKAYRSGINPDQDACKFAEAGIESGVSGAASAARVDRICGASKTFTTFQYIAYPVGAVAAGAGLILLLSAQGEGSAPTAKAKATRWALLPDAGPGRAGIDFRLAF